jgi:menaquinol-cytochrome c reductase iron-sulfur subunit
MTGDLSSNEEELGRRKFLAGIIGVVAGTVGFVVGVPAVAYIISPGVKQQSEAEWITLGPVSGLTVNVPSPFPYSRAIQDGWVQSSQAGVAYAVTYDGVNVTVYSDVCTHLSCRVTWRDERDAFVCPCHDGVFNVHGQVVSGPPPRPLDQFVSRIENGQVQILLEA